MPEASATALIAELEGAEEEDSSEWQLRTLGRITADIPDTAVAMPELRA
jgi:hypothetical protein